MSPAGQTPHNSRRRSHLASIVQGTMSETTASRAVGRGTDRLGDRTAQLLAAIGRVLSAISHAEFHLEPVLQEIADGARELCGADYSYVYLRDGNVFRVAADSGGTAAFRQYEREHPTRIGRDTMVGRVAVMQRPVIIDDVLADPEYHWAEGQRLAGYRSVIGLPIEVEGELIGVIGVARNAVAPFTEQEVETVSIYAGQAGVALRIAGLLSESHEAVEREAAVGGVLQAIARASFDLDEVLQAVIERAVELCRADSGNVARRDGDLYRVVAFTGFGAEYEKLARARVYRPERGSLIGRALLEGRVVHIPDVLEDPEYALTDQQRVGGYRTVLSVPMVRDGGALGAIGVGRNRVDPFSEREIRLFQTFADQAVIAIQIASLLQTVERQRTELARFAPQVASLLSSDEGQQLLAGHRREITALFADLRGFTAFAESAEPEEVLGVLREYHAAAGELVVRNGGTLEHFAGDGLMAFFNDPAPVHDHQRVAVRTAIELRERFTGLAARWRKRGYELGLGIGLGVGYATLGRIGFEGRYDYGAVGNVVILASRLSDAAQPGEILISQRLHAAVEDEVEAEPTPELHLKGFSRPVVVYRVLGSGGRQATA